MISTGRTEEMHSSLDCSVLPISSLELDFLVNIRTWEEFPNISLFMLAINDRAGIRRPSLLQESTPVLNQLDNVIYANVKQLSMACCSAAYKMPVSFTLLYSEKATERDKSCSNRRQG